MTVNFRQRARDALARGKLEMASSDFERLKYAALELRMAIEALSYERAQSYRDELPPSAYRLWQPKKLLQELLEIEPLADKSSSIRYGVEDVPGQRAKEMTFIGKETVFDLRAVKRHYDALGSFLHSPTLKQLEESGAEDAESLQRRCTEIVQLLDLVLSSPVFNIKFGSFTSIECVDPECSNVIRKRLPHGEEVVEARCFKCEAGYRITVGANGECMWEPLQQEIVCPTETCEHKFSIWRHEIKVGSTWRCPECSVRFRLDLAILEVKE